MNPITFAAVKEKYPVGTRLYEALWNTDKDSYTGFQLSEFLITGYNESTHDVLLQETRRWIQKDGNWVSKDPKSLGSWGWTYEAIGLLSPTPGAAMQKIINSALQWSKSRTESYQKAIKRCQDEAIVLASLSTQGPDL